MRRATDYIKALLHGTRAPAQPRNKALWSIGIYSGTTPLALLPDARVENPVITRDHVTDVPAAFVADPFLLHASGTWHLFFEVFNRRNHLGEIGLATSADLLSWSYQRIVLTEPFHLSYPHVFEWMGAYYMVPETHKTRTIRLYRAERFPDQWTLVHTLISGRPFSDATLFRHEDRWWLFTETSPTMKHDTLRLYSSNDLFGSWTEHPASPIVDGNVETARPAGSIVHVPGGGGLIRYAQVCRPRYGTSVNAFDIRALTTTTYDEQPASLSPILTGSATGWNATRMHHVDAHLVGSGHWIAAVDGAFDVTLSHLLGDP